MPLTPALYSYDLTTHRNVWASAETRNLWGYTQAELHAMGDRLLCEIIDHDDMHLVEAHHRALAALPLGGCAELYCRAWGKGEEHPWFVHFVDRCVAHDGQRCTLIEGSVQRVTVDEFDARRLIHRAVLRQQLTLHYQPICDLVTGEVRGYEALARWNHGGILKPPATFLGALEGTALELPWLKQQIALVEAALLTLPEPLWVSLNVSESALAGGALPSVLAGCAQPGRLHVEILESVSLHNIQTIDALRRIKASCHMVFADDIGEVGGLSRFLQQELFDGIKLDRVLINGLPEDERLCLVTKHVLDLASDLKLQSVAEWVESQQQVDWLLKHGCTFGQGSFFSMPKPLEEFL